MEYSFIQPGRFVLLKFMGSKYLAQVMDTNTKYKRATVMLSDYEKVKNEKKLDSKFFDSYSDDFVVEFDELEPLNMDKILATN